MVRHCASPPPCVVLRSWLQTAAITCILLVPHRCHVRHTLRFEGPLPGNFQRVATPEAFLEAVAGDSLIIADFFVPWCVACRRFHPALAKLAAAHPDCTFLSVRQPPHSPSKTPLISLHGRSAGPPSCTHPTGFLVDACRAVPQTVTLQGGPVCVQCAGGHGPRSRKHSGPAADPEHVLLQVNGADSALHDFVASLGVDRLPYFQFYSAGRILSQFAANLSKLKLLRREIERCKEQILQPGGSSSG